ncbi:hypothetical protein [Paraburkholderia tropica]|uniref:hypothetical protein n=1 Tax=Paraburkholderia tropica TaxID=92647 RepID=UPI0015908248|nr:hypothetical protein [Paraburkholderia tropica]
MDAKKLTDVEIDLIANDGMRNAAGGIYSTRVHEFARGVEAAVRDALEAELASMTRMFHAACADLGAINEALGLDPDDGGAEPIIEAIEELKAQIAALAHSDAVQAPSGWKLVPTKATNEMLIALLSGGEADALAGCKDGYIASRLLEASGVAARFSAMLNAAPVAPAAAAINLEGLRKKLLTPRKILRDEQGWCWHPDYPICDEGTRGDKFLEALGIEPAFVDMESDLPDFAERYHEEGLTDCTEWTPTPPAGEGWLLLEIYDTEDGPCALFGRDQYEAENAQKRQRTRELSERIKQRQADKGAAQ